MSFPNSIFVFLVFFVASPLFSVPSVANLS